MKKNIFIIACCTTLISISTIAYGAGPYVSGNLGFTIPNDSDATDSGITAVIESDTGLGLGVALGYDAEFIRYEAEFVYQKNDMDNISATGYGTAPLDGDTTSYGVLLNFYYDIRSKSAFIPYLTAGVGYANVEVSSISVPGFGPVTASSYDDGVLAYQFGVGVGVPFNEAAIFDIKYRYFGTSDPDFQGTKIEYSSHNIYAGIRYSF